MLLSIGLLALFWTASDPDIPIYDVDKICGNYYQNENGVNGCIRLEQQAYDLLKVLWPRLSANERASCLNYLTSAKIGHYRTLESCAAGLVNRDELLRKRSFRY